MTGRGARIRSRAAHLGPGPGGALTVRWKAMVSGAAFLVATMAPMASSAVADRSGVGDHAKAGLSSIRFEENRGQTDPRVRFLVHMPAGPVFLTNDGITISLAQAGEGGVDRDVEADHGRRGTRRHAVKMHFAGGSRNPVVEGIGLLEGTSNYIAGNDPSEWTTGVRSYGRVIYHDVYPGIDVEFYESDGRIEYDFLVAPGQDPGRVRLTFEGTQPRLDPNGELVLATPLGDVRQLSPIALQSTGGSTTQVPARFRSNPDGSIGFDLAPHDPDALLRIDPVLSYSTRLGGSTGTLGGFDEGSAIAVDSAGSAYVTGLTGTPDFPVTAGAYDTACGIDGACDRSNDVFVTKLDPSGSKLVYSTFLGATGVGNGEVSTGMAVDSRGRAYVVGYTYSPGFPTTADAYDRVCGCADDDQPDAFLAVLNKSGSGLVYSTFLGGAGSENEASVAVDAAGVAYLTGTTFSAPATIGGDGGFPTTEGGLFPRSGGNSDAYLARIDPARAAGASLLYASYLGGDGSDRSRGIAIPPGCTSDCPAYVVGWTYSTNFPTTAGAFAPRCAGDCFERSDAFVTAFNPGGGSLLYSTHLGGSLDDSAGAVAVDTTGHAYITGSTNSNRDFPLLRAYDSYSCGGDPPDCVSGNGTEAFVTRMAPSGDAIDYSSFLGGDAVEFGQSESGNGIAIDGQGRAHVVGTSEVPNFPTKGTLQCKGGGAGSSDAFVAEFDTTRSGADSLVYATFLGSSGNDYGSGIAVDATGSSYVTGGTHTVSPRQKSDDFPTTTGSFQSAVGGVGDAFVAKLGAGSLSSVCSVSPRGGPTGGGSEVVIRGEGFTDTTAVSFGNQAAAGFSIDSDTQITAYSPSRTEAPLKDSLVFVTVTTPAGTSTVNPGARYVFGEGGFEPVAKCPTVNSDSPTPRCLRRQLLVLPDGRVLATGFGTVALYDPGRDLWGPSIPCPGCNGNSSATLLDPAVGGCGAHCGKVLIAGGGEDTALRTASLFDPATGGFTPVGEMVLPRFSHTATLLGNGKVLIVGGCTGACLTLPEDDPTATTELFDPATASFSLAAPMSAARWFHSATLLVGPGCAQSCGKVLAVGGADPSGEVGHDHRADAVTTTELFDPTANAGLGSWTPADDLNGARSSHRVVTLKDGRLLAAGGYNGVELSSAEVYNPSDGVWQQTGSLAFPRWLHTATGLPNGKVLVAGGHGPDQASAEIFDPSTGTWGSATMMAGFSRARHSAVLLPTGPDSACGRNCGKVLILGSSGLEAQDEAELYTPRPQVTSLSPPLGEEGTVVTVAGTGLAGARGVTFGGVPARDVRPDPAAPDTRLVVVAPPHAAGQVDVAVTTRGGTQVLRCGSRFRYGSGTPACLQKGLPLASVGDVAVSEGDAATRLAVFTVSLSKPAASATTVGYSTADGTAGEADFSARSGVVSFAAGATSATVKVPVTGDTAAEGDERFTLALSAPTEGVGIGDGHGVGTVVDDDPAMLAGPVLTVGDVSVHEGGAGGRAAVFTVGLSRPSASTAAVSFAIAPGTAAAPADYSSVLGRLSFPPGTTSLTVKVVLNADTLEEGDETFVLTLSSPKGAALGDPSGVGTIINDD